MHKAEVTEFFGGAIRAAEKLGLTPQAVYKWPDDKPIPERNAILAESASSGALKYDPEAYRELRRKFAANRQGKPYRRRRKKS